MKISKLGILCLFVMLLFCVITCQSQFKIENLQQFSHQSLHKNTTLFNSKQRELKIQDVLKIPTAQFESLKNENTDLGFTNDNYWLHFQIKNDMTDEVQYYIETSRPIVDFAEFYQIDKDGTIHKQVSGDGIPFEKRSFQHRKTIFKIELKPNETGNYYIHLKSDGEVINAPVIMRTSEDLITETSFEQIVFGFFYGLLAIASILYFFFYFAMKERVFLYYSLYVVFIGLLQFSLDGYFYQFITPGSGWLSNRSVLLFAVISGSFLGKYAQNYLQVGLISKYLNLMYNTLYVLFGILFLVIILIPSWFPYCYPAMNGLGLFLLLLIISSLVVIYYKTKRVYEFFTLGVISLITGFVLFILKNFSLLPYNFITENSSKLGTGVEVIFLSLSMANLIKNLKEDREKLQELALQKSEEMNEMKSYFLSNISHELRTPLNAIMNFIESIEGETDSKSIKEKSEIIKGSSSSLLSSVNDILDFSKIEKDEIRLEVTEFNAHNLLEDIRTNIAGRAKEQGLDFVFSKPNDLPEMVKGDGERIRQILMNLLLNALKFTEKGFVKFTIESEVNDDSVDLKFIISDTGVGISKEKLNSIYDSFSQQSIDNKRKYGGLGLGLYIVKALVNLHKGSIELQSILNQGTVCEVNLKVEKAEVKPVVQEVTAEFDLNGKRILVVEDNAMNQMVLKMIMKKWLNTEVDFANNGEEALEIMKTIKFDVILMDLQMPVMDGYEATIEIRKGNSGINDKNIPIIAVTADVMETTKDRVKEIGMDYYLSKPVDKSKLYNTILEIAC